MMNTKIFAPHFNYRTKLHLIYTLLALGVLVVASLLALILSTDRDIGRSGALLFWMIAAGCDLLLWLIAMILVRYYYRSLSYEIQDDEAIVRVGIWTKSVKHVPYRTVTNLTIKRDILDRWLFNIGTLTIQTAGMSGMQGAEETLVGFAECAGGLRDCRDQTAPFPRRNGTDRRGRGARTTTDRRCRTTRYSGGGARDSRINRCKVVLQGSPLQRALVPCKLSSHVYISLFPSALRIPIAQIDCKIHGCLERKQNGDPTSSVFH